MDKEPGNLQRMEVSEGEKLGVAEDRGEYAVEFRSPNTPANLGVLSQSLWEAPVFLETSAYTQVFTYMAGAILNILIHLPNNLYGRSYYFLHLTGMVSDGTEDWPKDTQRVSSRTELKHRQPGSRGNVLNLYRALLLYPASKSEG